MHKPRTTNCKCLPCQITHLSHGVDTYTGPIDLDFVSVHGSVGHQDVDFFQALGLPHANLLVQDEALVQERLLQAGLGRKVTGIALQILAGAPSCPQQVACFRKKPLSQENELQAYAARLLRFMTASTEVFGRLLKLCTAVSRPAAPGYRTVCLLVWVYHLAEFSVLAPAGTASTCQLATHPAQLQKH